VQLILANPPCRPLGAPDEKILGDKKHAAGFFHRITVWGSSIQHRNARMACKIE
jgi:hypothetical protein